jgi:hypothetical protein
MTGWLAIPVGPLGCVGWAKARFAPCPPWILHAFVVGTLRFAHPSVTGLD